VSAALSALENSAGARKRWEEDYLYARDLAYYSHSKTFEEIGLVDKSPPIWSRVFDPVVHEYLKHYMPHLIFKAPHRNVWASGTADPLVAAVVEESLKEAAKEYNLKNEARKGIVQGLLGGECAMWTYLCKTRGIVVSEYVNMLDLLLDCDVPDRNYAKWVSRKRVAPIWWARHRFSNRDLMPNAGMKTALTNVRGSTSPGIEKATNDLFVYYEVWSKMGDFSASRYLGAEASQSMPEDYAWFVVAPGCKEFVDLKNSWPYDVYEADGCYPVSTWGHFYDGESVYAANPIRCIFGYQKFLNWALSFFLSRLRVSSPQKLFVKSGELTRAARRALESNEDLAIVELNKTSPGAISDFVDILKYPDVQGDFFRALQHVYERIRELLGLRGILMGETQTAQRSAMEADIKDRNARVPIESMADGVEDWMSEVGRKEMLLTLGMVPMKTTKTSTGLVRGIERFGETASTVWKNRPKDPDVIANEYGVEVYAGASRKRDQASAINDADAVFQMIAQSLQLVGDIVDPMSRLAEVNRALNGVGTSRMWEAAKIPQFKPNPALFQQQAAPMQEAGQEQQEPQRVTAIQDGQPVYGGGQ